MPSLVRDKIKHEPLPSDEPDRQVTFLHPGYQYHQDLLTLPALDNGGIHYGTALTFCGIVAGNSFANAFFATSREADPEKSDWDSILTEDVYYFFAGPNRADKYRIYNNFSDWPFPAELPLEWQKYTIPPKPPNTSIFSNETLAGQWAPSCRVTADCEACEAGYLVPKSEKEWFLRNNMDEYVHAGDPNAIEWDANSIRLRADVRILMDDLAWVPMLKEGQLVACTICHPRGRSSRGSFRDRYQNTALQDLKGVSKECLFARIALAILPETQQLMYMTFREGSPRTHGDNDMRQQIWENFKATRLLTTGTTQQARLGTGASTAKRSNEKKRTEAAAPTAEGSNTRKRTEAAAPTAEGSNKRKRTKAAAPRRRKKQRKA